MDYDSLILLQNCIELDASASVDEVRDDFLFHWRFGDEEEKMGQIVQYCYDSIGNYEITLSVTDTTEKTQFRDEWVYPISIEADHLLRFNSKRIEDELTFSAWLESVDPINEVRFFWDFGDGDFAVGKEVKHQYRENKKYEVRVLAELTTDREKISLSKTNTYTLD